MPCRLTPSTRRKDISDILTNAGAKGTFFFSQFNFLGVPIRKLNDGPRLFFSVRRRDMYAGLHFKKKTHILYTNLKQPMEGAVSTNQQTLKTWTMSTKLAIKLLRIPGDTLISQPLAMKTVHTFALVWWHLNDPRFTLVEAQFLKLDRKLFNFIQTRGGGCWPNMYAEALKRILGIKAAFMRPRIYTHLPWPYRSLFVF